MIGDSLHQSAAGHAYSDPSWLDAHFEACRPEYESAFQSVGIRRGWHVLDAGCGSGSFVPMIADAVSASGSVTALDLDPRNVAIVRRRASDEWNVACPIGAVVGSVIDLPFPDDHFDAIWCANTTQYLPNDDLLAALREFRRVVRPGGLLAIKDVDPFHFVMQPAIPGLLRRHFETALLLPTFNPAKGVFRVWSLPAYLAEAGVEPLWHRTSIIERRAPLRPVEQTYLKQYLAGSATINVTLKADLTNEADLGAWRELLDVAAANHLVDRPDFYWCEGQAVSVGRVPFD